MGLLTLTSEQAYHAKTLIQREAAISAVYPKS